MDYLESVKKIVKDASKLMFLDNIRINEKGNSDNLVTTADIAVQQFLQEKLTSLIPSSGFFGEECSPFCNEAQLCWIVDPIDGTMNFVRNMRQSAISVALRDNNEVILGVVYNPFTDEMFYAQKNRGAFINGRQMNVSDKSFDKGILCSAMSLYNKKYAETCKQIIMDIYMRCSDIRRFGTAALELCYIADGRCDLYYEYILFPWDYAAASLIVFEAGGFIGSPFDDSVSLTHECPVIAANTKENYNNVKNTVLKYMHGIPYLK